MRARLRREDGISLTVAIISLSLMIILAGVALPQAVDALRHAREQADVKRALAAAEAAIDVAVFRLARADLGGTLNIDPTDPGTITSQNCVVSRGDVAGGIDLQALDMTLPPDPDGRRWCPVTEAEDAGEGGRFRYRVSQLARAGSESCGDDSLLSLDREIVAEGRSGRAVRRVHARLRASVALLSGAAVQSVSETSNLTLGGSARVLGSVHSNAHITGTATNVVAGNATPGPPDKTVTGVLPAGSTDPACEKFLLPPVQQDDAPTDNHNTARTDGCVDLTALAAVPCKVLLTTTGGVTYDAPTRTLTVWGNGRTILNGSTYSFCHIRLRDQAILQVPYATPVTRIFLDDPDNCRKPDGSPAANAGQITMDGMAQVVNCHPQTQPQSLQLYALGNEAIATTQTLAGASPLTGSGLAALCGVSLTVAGVPMVVYAPRSTVAISGSTGIAGQVAAEVVNLSGASAVQPVNALVNLNQLGSNPVLPLYRPTEFIECTGHPFERLPSENPAQGC